ncbi:hypothetical protein FMN50_11700 [Rhodobacterales bacterium]|nr:hypothetical protein FMN50_11700 [Rhodobacterales bacterium]
MLDLARCDAVFLSFDEPNADPNYQRVQDIMPRARRVNGIKGFDSPHRKAGEISESPYVITIDADNVLIDESFFAGCLDISPRDRGAVFSFCARNVVNGLKYGNGGVKIWPRETLITLRSHENARRKEAAVDFCWTVPYFQINRVLSEVHMATTPFQAFRGGFREGVKFNLAGGTLAYDAFPDLPKKDALLRHIGLTNRERLRVWCSVGMDMPNGDWAILGSRLGCCMTALDRFDPAKVADYAWFLAFWQNDISPNYRTEPTRHAAITTLGHRLNAALSLDITTFPPSASRTFKSTHQIPRASGLTPTV